MSKRLVGVGPAVADVRVPGRAGTGDKVDAAITWGPGGGAFNLSESASAVGAATTLVSLVGDDPLGEAVVAAMRMRLSEVIVAAVMEQTRLSVVLDGRRSLTARHSVCRPLPEASADVIRQAGVLVVAPFQPADHAFVAQLLTLARPAAYRVLTPSQSQLADPRSLDLLRAADLVVLNQEELHTATGTRDLLFGIYRLGDLGVRNVVVTAGPAGAVARVGEWYDQAAFPVASIAATTRAGDTFTGILTGALACGLSFPESLRLATAGAAYFVERAQVPCHDEVVQFAAERSEGVPPLARRARAEVQRERRTVLRRVGYGAAAAVTMGLVMSWYSPFA